MNQEEGATRQQQEQEAAAAADDDDGDGGGDASVSYPPLQRYDRVRFWKSSNSPHLRCSPHQHTNNEEDGFLGVVQELLDDDFFEISFNDGDEVTIHRACIELVMPAALWVKEAFKRWCQKEIIDTSRTFFVFPNGFQFQRVEYENIFLDDEMACELENALCHNETFEIVRITIESPMLLQRVNREQLNNLVMALLSSPNLKRLILDETEDQDVVNASFRNLWVAGQLTHLKIVQSLLPNMQFSQDFQDVKEQKATLILRRPEITSLEASRNFAAQVVALNWFGSVCLNGCSSDFVCSLLQEMAINNSNINRLKIWQMHTPATAVVSNERTGTRGLFLEALRSCLISRAENNLQPLQLSISQININYHHFAETLLLHDNICYLDISGETVDDEVANAIGHLLRTTKKLRALELPGYSNYSWTCSEKRQLEFINSIAMNQSLHELSIGGIPVGILFGALCQNHSLEKLIFDGSPGDQAGPDDLEALKSFTTLRELEIDGSSFDVVSVAAALRKNTSLEHVEMPCYYPAEEEDDCCTEICTNNDQVCTYLARNKWFHQNEALLLKNPGNISAALWSHVLARVSSNPTFLFKLTQANPDIFRPCSYMPAE